MQFKRHAFFYASCERCTTKASSQPLAFFLTSPITNLLATWQTKDFLPRGRSTSLRVGQCFLASKANRGFGAHGNVNVALVNSKHKPRRRPSSKVQPFPLEPKLCIAWICVHLILSAKLWNQMGTVVTKRVAVPTTPSSLAEFDLQVPLNFQPFTEWATLQDKNGTCHQSSPLKLLWHPQGGSRDQKPGTKQPACIVFLNMCRVIWHRCVIGKRFSPP